MTVHGYVCLCLSSVCIFWNPIMEIKEVLETEEGIQAGEAGLRLCFLSCYTQAWVAPGLSGGPKQLMCWWSLQSSCSVNTEAPGRESVRFCSGLASGRALSLSYTHPHVPTHTDTLKCRKTRCLCRAVLFLCRTTTSLPISGRVLTK